ncbi:5-hydroxytryptamine receptor 2B-like [Saccostrea echinata]|uniref:5-hydroxytryptamine receptor 2B-like n=1 Tax=Saccostrea echinata TaxID=191078 RepID=UPI002A8246AF|nr:5-hydroxytryptamine receptor 2B-like [Saccostrea echinata]
MERLNQTNDDGFRSTEDLNRFLAHKYQTNTVLVSILLSIGVIGNSIVILTYHFRMKNKRDDRYFIPCLAITNMLACMSASVMSVTMNSIPAMFTSESLCKGLNFVTRVTCVESLIMLLIISMQRYKKICTKGRNRFSLLWKRLAIVISIIVSSIFSFPTLIFYGIKPIKRTRYNNITEFHCELTTNSDHAKYGLHAYLAFVALLFLGIVLSISVIYTFIGKRIHSNIQPPQKSAVSTSYDSLHYNSLLKYSKSDSNLQNRLQAPLDESSDAILQKFTEKNGVPPKRSQSEAGKRKYTVSEVKKVRSRIGIFVFRYYYMFVSISFVTFVSFIPPIIIMVLEAIDSEVIGDISSDFGFNFILLLRRSYLFSYTINPFMFGLFDTTFRKALIDVCQLVCLPLRLQT